MEKKYTGIYPVRKGSKQLLIKWSINGYRFQEVADTEDYEVAYQLREKRIEETRNGAVFAPKVTDIKMDELFDDVIHDYEDNGYRSLDMVQLRLKNHVSKFFQHRLAIAVNVAVIEMYKQKRKGEDASNATINRELAIVRRAFNLGVQNQKVAHGNVPVIRLLREQNARQGFYEDKDFAILISYMEPAIADLCLFAKVTGWRRGEVLSLQWPQVDFAHGIIRLEPGTTKSGEGRQFPITSELDGILQERKAASHPFCPYVFSVKGRQVSRSRLQKAWNRAHKDARLPHRIFHDLRRTAVRNFVRRGIGEHIAMKLSGHKTNGIFKRYDIVSEQDLRDAGSKLEIVVSAKKQEDGK